MAERKNSTLVEKARSIMSLKNVLEKFWVEAIIIAIYLSNLSSTIVVLNQTPFETWNGLT